MNNMGTILIKPQLISVFLFTHIQKNMHIVYLAFRIDSVVCTSILKGGLYGWL